MSLNNNSENSASILISNTSSEPPIESSTKIMTSKDGKITTNILSIAHNEKLYLTPPKPSSKSRPPKSRSTLNPSSKIYPISSKTSKTMNMKNFSTSK